MSILKNRDIVVVGQQPWDTSIGSNCKDLALEFSKNNRVLYVNAALDRRTAFQKRNTEGVNKRKRIIAGNEKSLEEIAPNLWVFYPETILESINWIKIPAIFRWLNEINNQRFAKTIKTAIKKLDFKNFVLFNDNDIFRSYHLKQFLNPSISVYYSRDYIIATPYWAHHGKYLEPELIKKSDVCVANSTYLADYCKKYNPNSFYVGQGCDFELFKNDDTVQIPEEFSAINQPILGYVGALLSIRLDEAILLHLAKERPDWNIVLVGPEDDDFKKSELHRLKNVHFLGPKKPETLAHYIKGFDICLNPQIVNELTIGNYPRKIDEYLAMGKPTIATKTEAIGIFNEYVYIAASKEEYVLLAEKALMENTPDLAKKRIAFAHTHSWQKNAKEIYKAINYVAKNLVLDKGQS